MIRDVVTFGFGMGDGIKYIPTYGFGSAATVAAQSDGRVAFAYVYCPGAAFAWVVS